MPKVLIYVLKDPITDEIRYVGETTRKLNERLVNHISVAKNSPKTPRDEWIRELLQSGHKPIIECIETCNSKTWEQRERHWIDYHIGNGCSLTNIARGGKDMRPAGHIAMEPMNTGFSKENCAAIRALSKSTGLSIGEIIRRAINYYLVRLGVSGELG